MDMKSISVPEVYQESIDFRFFLSWFQSMMMTVQHNTENFMDLYDPLRCPADLLWLLADTMGFRYDDRFITAYNRFVLKYFMDMISNRGSERGMEIAAEANLKQFELNLLAITGYYDADDQWVEPKEILSDRLEDTSIPVNTASVVPHPDLGYIDVVYFSENTPTDACLEYVRPVGMYVNACAGVKIESRNKVSIDARLVDDYNLLSQIQMNRVANYTREDYAKLQKVRLQNGQQVADQDRKQAYKNNSTIQPPTEDAGYRTLYSMQLSNNVQTVRGLLPSGGDWIFNLDSLGYNLQYDQTADHSSFGDDVRTVDSGTTSHPVPAVNPVMTKIGDAISLNPENSAYYSLPDE